jgi:regulation of enolase protein 1 (concanavalin A-like superfamily)
VRRLALLVVLLVGALGAQADAASDLSSLSDEFDSSASLANWQVMQGDVIDGAPARYTIVGGELVVHAAHTKWIDDQHAFYLWKEVKGDFVATVRVSVSGEQGAVPTANWSLAGLLVRSPQTSNENWLNFTVGRARGKNVFERKSTRSTRSILVLNPAPTGWLELRQVRIGNRFYLLRRADGGKWVVHWTYIRHLPAMLQVGIDVQSGSGDDHADLLARADYLHFAPTNVPPRLRARVLRGRASLKALRPYLTR